MGVKGFLGGEYNYQYSELSVKQRIWLSSWGKLDVYVKGGVQWSRVPYPLLCMPEANLSYILHRDMYETWSITWSSSTTASSQPWYHGT